MKAIPSVLLRLALVLVGFAGARVSAMVLPTTPVSLDTALRDARAMVADRVGFEIMRVSGRSMLPFFGDGSVLVVKKIPAAKLRPGMVVVYQNRFGETVAHRVVGGNATGWTVRGYNNEASDSTAVTEANLIGVVYATLHSNGQAPAADVASILAESTRIAMAAPAR